MKKKLIIIVILALTMLTACQKFANEETNTDSQLNIIATVFPQYDFVDNIIGEEANLSLLLTPGADTHSFEPSPKDIIDIGNCDVFIYTGGETWVDDVLASIDNEDMTIICLMDIVDIYEEELVEGMESDHDHEDADADTDTDHEHEDEDKDTDHDHEGEDTDHEDEIEYDEHVWTSPKNAIAIVEYITNELVEKDEKNKETYTQNSEKYIGKLEEVDNYFVESLESISNNTIVVADKFPFRYLAEAYSLEYYAAFLGCSTQTNPSAATVAFLIDKVNEDNIPVVFYTEQSNQSLPDTICESTDAKKVLLHSCHNLTQEEMYSGVDYISLMMQNADNLKEALQ